MKTKRILTLALILAMTLALAACGGKNQPGASWPVTATPDTPAADGAEQTDIGYDEYEAYTDAGQDTYNEYDYTATPRGDDKLAAEQFSDQPPDSADNYVPVENIVSAVDSKLIGTASWLLGDTAGYRFKQTIRIYDAISGKEAVGAGHPNNFGNKLQNFDYEKDIAVPIVVSVENVTAGMDSAMVAKADMIIGRPGGPDLLTKYQYSGDGKAPTSSDKRVSVIKYYSSDIESETFNSYNLWGYGERGGWGVQWTDKYRPGETRAADYFLIVHDYFSPLTPEGDRALLDCITIKPLTYPSNQSGESFQFVYSGGLSYKEGSFAWSSTDYAITLSGEKIGNKMSAKIVEAKPSSTILSYKSDEAAGAVNLCVDFVDEALHSGYNRGLAETALMLSSSAYERSESNNNLTTLGFSDIVQYNYGASEVVNKLDYVAYSFGRKSAVVSGVNYDLIAVVLRGTKDNMEWVSNIESNLSGFSTAKNEVLSDLRAYCDTHGVGASGKTKFFITSHSRGAAVANLLAMDLIDDYSYPQDDVITYTFATPNVTSEGNAKNYANIINICLPSDPVTGIPPLSWKHGITYVYPSGKDDLSDDDDLATDMQLNYMYITNRISIYAYGMNSRSDHYPEVYLAWLMAGDPTHIETLPGIYEPRSY
ncbi:MAG: hypothetical protein LBK23_11610 [Oscillospiraceae bacterium]|jgi:hypothetical protein|nr:hypothetical protein [Oscillospiraceae bacterium]